MKFVEGRENCTSLTYKKEPVRERGKGECSDLHSVLIPAPQQRKENKANEVCTTRVSTLVALHCSQAVSGGLT